MVLVDLIKVLYTLDHAILIQKPYHYGVRVKELDWFQSNLQDHKQYCKVNGYYVKNRRSELQHTTRIVPRLTSVVDLHKRFCPARCKAKK